MGFSFPSFCCVAATCACAFELAGTYDTGDDRRGAVIDWTQSASSNDTDTPDRSVNEYLYR